MEREFKVGDRVVYKEYQLNEDFGVISDFQGDLIWIDWQSTMQNSCVTSSYIKQAEPEVNFEEALRAYVKVIGYLEFVDSDEYDVDNKVAEVKQWYADSKKADPELEAAKALCEANGFKVTPC